MRVSGPIFGNVQGHLISTKKFLRLGGPPSKRQFTSEVFADFVERIQLPACPYGCDRGVILIRTELLTEGRRTGKNGEYDRAKDPPARPVSQDVFSRDFPQSDAAKRSTTNGDGADAAAFELAEHSIFAPRHDFKHALWPRSGYTGRDFRNAPGTACFRESSVFTLSRMDGQVQRIVLFFQRPVVAGFGVRGFEVVAKLALYLLTARILGVAEAGLFFLCLTWSSWFSTFGRMGIDRALTRHMGAELGLSQGATARRTLLAGVGRVTVTGLGLGIATGLGGATLAHAIFGDPALAPALVHTSIAVAGMSVTFTLTAALAGAGRTTWAQFLQNAFWPALTVLALVAGAQDATSLVTCMGIAIWVSGGIAGLIFFGDRTRFRNDAALSTDTPASGPVEHMPPLMTTAWPLMVVELVQATIVSVPVLLLGVMADAADVGAFSVALRISMLVWMVLVSLGTVASPRFAALHRKGDLEGLGHLNRQIQLIGTVTGGLVCLAMIVLPETLLAILSPGFTTAAVPLMILGAGQAINALYTGQDVLLAMTGNGGTLQRLNLAQLVVVLLLSVSFIPLIGASGAALATAIATAQGGLGAAMVAASLLPAARPYAALPLPATLRHLLALNRQPSTT